MAMQIVNQRAFCPRYRVKATCDIGHQTALIRRLMLDWSSYRNSSNSRLEHGHGFGEIKHPCALLCSVLSVMSTITGTDDTMLASHTTGL